MGLAALAACGTVKGDDTAQPDAPSVDTTAPQLVTSTPGDAGTKVSVIAPLTFTFDEALNASSVNDAAVTVTYASYSTFVQIVGTVTFDGMKTITFTPKLPLYTGGHYTIHLANTVKDLAGNAFAGKDLAFNTNTNQVTKRTYYNTTSNTVSQWTQYTLDTMGHIGRYVTFTAAGPDGNWFTADDVAQGHSEYFFNAAGLQVEYRSYDAGPDTIWNNGDDRIVYLAKYEVDSMGRPTGYTSSQGAGPDAMWGTADDMLTSVQTYTYASGKTTSIYYNGPGTDNVWKTADDRCSSYTENTLDARGNATRYTNFAPGPDNLAKTSDDVVQGYSDYAFDANGQFVSYRYYNAPGPDGTWFTSDDVTSGLQKQDVDANGFETASRYYSGPGPDGVWNTGDDVVGGLTTYTNDSHGLQLTQTGFNGPGTDGTYGTADDIVGYYYTNTYNADGQKMDTKSYQTAGPDNVWKTGDDRVGRDDDFDLAH